MHVHPLLAVSLATALLAACSGGDDDQAARADANPQQAVEQQATLPAKSCDLLPQADAERIVGKALVEQRNDDWACHYRDARGTEGTGLMLDRNVLQVSEQCRLVPGSEPLSGIGKEACIAIGRPVGLYTTVVFRAGGHTFEATAPGQDKESELSTAVAKVILARLGA